VKKLETKKSSENGNEKADFKPVIGIAIVSLLVCGMFFPLFITGIAQVLFPTQANGNLVHLDGRVVGSSNIAQNFTLPIFFQTRVESQSASGLDPDITLQTADSQIPGISNATGISMASLQQLVNQNIDPQGKATELQYVNVLSLNYDLIQDYPSVYSAYN
jgi:potassium-transporting ATPase KdpC subunit